THRWPSPLKTIGALAISSIFLYPLAILAWRRIKGPGADAPFRLKLFLILPMLALLPVLISFLVSQFLPHSVWGIRYLIIAAPAYLILLAYAAFELKSRWLRTVTIAFFVAWSALSGFLLLLHRDKLALNAMVAQMVRAETSPQEKINVYTNRNT